jgi:hypothetical protein
MDTIRIQRLAEDVAVQTYPRIGQLTAIPELSVSVWIVDGEYIRTFLDEEFTNFGQHYRFPFIPENEFWLDKEGENDESNYFIEHLKVEWNLMRQGSSYPEAIVQADLVERAMRLKDSDITLVQNPVTKIIDPTKFRLKLIKALDNGLKVWLVDGKLIRTFIHIDFTQGGHEYVYEFVPPGDIWIDNDIAWQERGFVILHEMNELNLMREGWAYTKAHENSSTLELHCRQNPSELHDALITVGWN